MEQRKLSRVHQLRDLFQSGTPHPSEELNKSGLKASALSANIGTTNAVRPLNKIRYVQKKVQEESVSELDSASVKSISDLSDPDGIFLADNVPSIARPTSSNSDSDVDSPRIYSPKKLIDPKTSDVKNPVEHDASILCPIVPYLGNQPTKIRPLGEEFRLRRISSNSQPSSKISDPVSRDDKSKDVHSSSSSHNNIAPPNYTNDSLSYRENLSNVNPITSSVKSDVNQQSLLSNVTMSFDGDSDADTEDTDAISHETYTHHPSKTVDNLDGKSGMDSCIQKSDSSYLTRSPIINRVTMNQSCDKPPNEENDAIVDRDPEFQDFLLESNNFQSDNPMRAESVELDDRTTSEDDFGDNADDVDGSNESENDYVDLGYEEMSTMLDTNNDEMSATINNISYEMICPHQKPVVSIASGCHILEDGHFFYEKLVDIDSDIESELESQNILSNNDVVKTYKRPGSTVHFNLNKVRVYSTYISDEYNRKNEDIDPLSSAAEYEMEKRLEKMKIFPVCLFKDNSGLGISILGMGVGHGTGMQKLGIFVKSITPDGAADKDGKIQVYDQIVEVNGQSLVSVSQDFAASVLRNTHGMVNFLIGRETDQLNSDIVRLVEKSRQNSGMISPQRSVSSTSTVQLDDEATKTENNIQKRDSQRKLPSNSKTGGDKDTSLMSPIVNVPPRIMDEDVESPKCIIDDLNHQLLQSRLNDAVMPKLITEITAQREQNKILKSELGLLSKNKALIEIELQKQQEIIKDLSNENSLLKEKLEETIKKYKKLKRINKIEEMKNEDLNVHDQSNLLIVSNDKKNKPMNCLELKTGDNNCYLEENDALSKEVVRTFFDKEIDNKDGQMSFTKRLSFSTESPNVQGQDPEKLLINFKINLTNNNNDVKEMKFPDLVNVDKILDNGPAKNKAELRKTSQMANRKPPTKSMMIGDQSREMIDTNSFVSHAAMSPSIADESLKNEKFSDKLDASKIIGGFALPGKDEIKSGIKPSHSIGVRKPDRGSQQSIISTPSTIVSVSSRSPDNENNPSNNHSMKVRSSSSMPTNGPSSDSLLSTTANTKVPSTIVLSNGCYKTKL